MVLIYSKDVDEFVNEVIDYLKGDFIRFGESDKIRINQITLSKDTFEVEVESKYFKAANLKNVQSIWFNGGWVSTEGNDYENECYSTMIHSVLNKIIIPRIGSMVSDYELNKLDVLIEAQKQGLSVPETLITGSKEKLMSFFNLHRFRAGLICKRMIENSIFFNEEDELYYDFRSTFSLYESIIDKIPDDFALTLFQEKIIPDFEVRTVLIDGNFYSMSIHDFDYSVDYRSKLDKKTVRSLPMNLPTDIGMKLKKVFESFNLNYGSADLIFKDGIFYLLEINPTGQVSFLNIACNYGLDKKLADILERYE